MCSNPNTDSNVDFGEECYDSGTWQLIPPYGDYGDYKDE